MNPHIQELLQESVAELKSFISHSTVDEHSSAQELVERIERVLPYKQVIRGQTSFTCSECSRVFRLPAGVGQHMQVHGWSQEAQRALAKRLSKAAKDEVVHWPTKAAYLEHVESTEAQCEEVC